MTDSNFPISALTTTYLKHASQTVAADVGTAAPPMLGQASLLQRFVQRHAKADGAFFAKERSSKSDALCIQDGGLSGALGDDEVDRMSGAAPEALPVFLAENAVAPQFKGQDVTAQAGATADVLWALSSPTDAVSMPQAYESSSGVWSSALDPRHGETVPFVGEGHWWMASPLALLGGGGSGGSSAPPPGLKLSPSCCGLSMVQWRGRKSIWT